MGKVEKIIRCFFIVFSLLIVCIKCAYLFNILPTFLAAAGAGIIIILTVLAFIYFERFYDRISIKMNRINALSYRKMLIIVAAVSIVTKLIAVAILQIESLNDGSDIDVYVNAAYELGTKGVATSHAGYLMSFSHMFWFGAFLAPIAGIFGISQMAFSIYLSIVLTVSTVLLFATFSETVGKNKAFVVFIIFSLLPGTILLPQYITHEIALLFFESIAVWLYFRVIPHCKSQVTKSIIYVLFVISLLLATMMNTAGIVICIAFAIVFIAKLMKNFSMVSFGTFLAKIVVMLAIILVGSKIAAGIQGNHCDVPKDYVLNDKVLWTLYVGSNVEHKGEWNTDDTKEFDSYDDSYSYNQIQDFREEKLINRYNSLLENPADILKLIKDKLVTIWGVFGYSILYANENVPNQHIQSIYNLLLDRPLLLIEFMASVIASIICFEEAVRHRKKSMDYALLIQLFLMGTTAMLMLTECRNKYTIAIQPFFYMACFVLCEKSSNLVNDNSRES